MLSVVLLRRLGRGGAKALLPLLPLPSPGGVSSVLPPRAPSHLMLHLAPL